MKEGFVEGCHRRLRARWGCEEGRENAALCRRPRTSLPGKGEEYRAYPYLLTGGMDRAVEAWCADICLAALALRAACGRLSPLRSDSYLPIGRGSAYLAAVMDWHTRAMLDWKLSNTLDTAFCLGPPNKRSSGG